MMKRVRTKTRNAADRITPDLDAETIFAPLKATPVGKKPKKILRKVLAVFGILFLLSFIIPPFVVPTEGVVTSSYSIRHKPDSAKWFDFEVHSGTDIANVRGTPVKASRLGIVAASGVSPSFGNYVIIDHFLGVSTVYAHLDSRAVRTGQFVTPASVIGKMGSTGRSTGNHLHFELRVFGAPVPSILGLFQHRLRRAVVGF